MIERLMSLLWVQPVKAVATRISITNKFKFLSLSFLVLNQGVCP
jgi:hypothetical protein